MSTDTPPRLRLEQYLGMQIKRQRQAQELKLADVARIAGISQGMLSKIENAQVSTSLDLHHLRVLRVSIDEFCFLNNLIQLVSAKRSKGGKS